MSLDRQIIDLAAKYRPLAAEFLREAVRIPADYVDRPDTEGGDPLCGLSNHEGPRLEYLKRMLVERRCVARPEDAFFDEYGNLVWEVQDRDDGIEPANKRVVYFDGHTDTVQALRDQWRDKVGAGMDAYDGLTNPDEVDREFLRRELGYIPPDDEWDQVIFGRGSADQLGGVICQMIATKIMLELKAEGALRGVIVRCYGTVAEEDNDGGGPLYLMQRVFPGAPPEVLPDVVILSEGTGCSTRGALGIYRGQRGRMQIEVRVTGRSCHGSMPWEGLNPLEYGAAILVEARDKYDARDGFKDHDFLGHGTRTASWAKLQTPSDCAVPDTFTFRFDRRLTVGEDPERARRDVEELVAVARARQAGLSVEVAIPRYQAPTWRGYEPDNAQIYPGWLTPEEHPVIRAAVQSYERVVTPAVSDAESERQARGGAYGGSRRQQPRVERWVFSTDGVGFLTRKSGCSIDVPSHKGWVESGPYLHPPMFGLGPGVEHNTHKIGECVDARELESTAALYARFPSLLAQS